MKALNTSMSVCEIGATIGRMWRELNDTEKQKYNEEFIQAKVHNHVIKTSPFPIVPFPICTLQFLKTLLCIS